MFLRLFCAIVFVSYAAAQHFSASVGPGLTAAPLPVARPPPAPGAGVHGSVSLGGGHGASASGSVGGYGASGHASLGGGHDARGSASAYGSDQHSSYGQAGYGVDASGHGGQASGNVNIGGAGASDYDSSQQQYGSGDAQATGQYDAQQPTWEGDDRSRQQPGQADRDQYGYPTDQAAPQPEQQSGHGDQDNRYEADRQDSRQDPRYPGYDTSRADPRNDPSRGDPRYDPSRADPRYDASRQQGQGYDSRGQLYPVTVKTFVMSESSIFVYWVDPYNAKGRGQQSTTKYQVKYSKGYDVQNEVTRDTAEKELRVTDLEPGTDYSFSVKVERDGRSSGWSAPVRNRTLEQLPSQPPTNIKVDARDRDATISISPPEGMKGRISSYLFLYAPSGGSSGRRQWTEQQVSGHSYDGRPATVVLRNLQPEEEYFYTVQATNSRGSSPFSDIQSFKVVSPYGPYGRPGSGVHQGYGPATPAPYNPYPDQPWDQQTTRSPYGDIAPPYVAYPDRDRYPTTTPSPYPYPGPPAPYPEDRRDDRYVVTPSPYPAPSPDAYDPYGQGQDQQTPSPPAPYYPYDTPAPYYPGQDDRREATTWAPYWGAAGAGASAGGHGATAGGSASVGGSYGAGSAYGSAYGSSYGSGQGGANVQGGAGVSGHGSSQYGSSYGASGSAAHPPAPSDLKAENLDGGVEILLIFTPSPDIVAKSYDIYYTDDPALPDDQWQKEQALGEDTQAVIGVAMFQRKQVTIKMRTITDQGTGEFGAKIQHDVGDPRGAGSAGAASHYGQDQDGSRSTDSHGGSDVDVGYHGSQEEDGQHSGHAQAEGDPRYQQGYGQGYEADARYSGHGGASAPGQASAGGHGGASVGGQTSAGRGQVGASGHAGLGGHGVSGHASVGTHGISAGING